MSSKYEGGLGTREGGDLVRWSLEIDNGIESAYTYGSRTPQPYLAREPTAELTLKSITREESIAVIALINEMRGGGPKEYAKPSPIGNRFSGLEFD